MKEKRNKICLYDKLKINMKKILLFLICFLTILITAETSYSAVPTEAPTLTPMLLPPVVQMAIPYVPGKDTPVPGVNCGDSTSEEINKCCYNSPVPDPNLDLIREAAAKKPLLSQIADLATPVEHLISLAMKKFSLNKLQAYIDPCVIGSPSDLKDASKCICVKTPDDPLNTLIPLCGNIKSDGEADECRRCFQGRGDQPVGVWTGAGCIYANTKSFIEKTVFGWGIGLAGTIALFCIIYSAFQIQISQGNPEKLKKAQETLTSCIVGLMLIIFSVFILKVIGVDILKIPF